MAGEKPPTLLTDSYVSSYRRTIFSSSIGEPNRPCSVIISQYFYRSDKARRYNLSLG
ncbi:hypothetical protein BJY04DRAFT_34307 [Aspergillus karnatakaensis]|uniref:uncharacterized protein n=1 Tax=Aspergillus karnatakaensis TaxID=1810916 RepID=UPI003CCDA969